MGKIDGVISKVNEEGKHQVGIRDSGWGRRKRPMRAQGDVKEFKRKKYKVNGDKVLKEKKNG